MPNAGGLLSNSQILNDRGTAARLCRIVLLWRIGQLRPATSMLRTAPNPHQRNARYAASVAAPESSQGDCLWVARSGLALHDRTCDHLKLVNLLAVEIRVASGVQGCDAGSTGRAAQTRYSGSVMPYFSPALVTHETCSLFIVLTTPSTIPSLCRLLGFRKRCCRLAFVTVHLRLG
jgi:hypothetical protein